MVEYGKQPEPIRQIAPREMVERASKGRAEKPGMYRTVLGAILRLAAPLLFGIALYAYAWTVAYMSLISKK